MASSVFAFPNFINYQGQLTDASDNPLNGEYILTFMIYGSETEGGALWAEQHTVMVTNGLYNAELGTVNPFPEDLFETEMLYLEVIIHNTDTDYDETLSPRIPFTSTGFSMKAKDAETVAWSNITGKDVNDADADPTNELQTLGISGNNITLSDGGGSITVPYATNAATANDADKLDGKDSSEFGDGHSLDAADGDPVDVVYVDSNGNVRIGTSTPNTALQVIGAISREGTTLSGTYTDTHINLGINSLTEGYSSIISGGMNNFASDNFSTVSGGVGNTASGNSSTISGGSQNTASDTWSTVSGGWENTASGTNSTISGGTRNTASGHFSTVSGGVDNTAIGLYSSVSGGYYNTANGLFSTVSGGWDNIAAGDYSWVCGRNMQLTEDADRTFAWGYSDSNVSISTPDAFIIYSGNVGIGTTSPGAKLEVHDDSTGIWPNAGSALKVSDGNGNVAYLGADDHSPWVGSFSNTSFRIAANQLTHVTIRPTGNVGIGTTNPNYKLHIIGDIAYTGNIYDVSDIRLKENITSIENAVEKVSSINGIYFNNKGESPEKREVGVIAQEVEEVLPEVVSEDNDGYKSVNYSKLTPLLIEAIKELKSENEELKERILALEAALQP